MVEMGTFRIVLEGWDGFGAFPNALVQLYLNLNYLPILMVSQGVFSDCINVCCVKARNSEIVVDGM